MPVYHNPGIASRAPTGTHIIAQIFEPGVMKKRAAAFVLALLPLAGCAAPYGYSPGAWSGYDRDFDLGYQGYGGYYDQPYRDSYYEPSSYGGYGQPYRGIYYRRGAGYGGY